MPGGGCCDSKSAQFAAQMKTYGWRPHRCSLELHAQHLAEQNKLKSKQVIDRINHLRRSLLLVLHRRNPALTHTVLKLIRHLLRHLEKLYADAASLIAVFGTCRFSLACACPGGSFALPSRGPPSEDANKMIDSLEKEINKEYTLSQQSQIEAALNKKDYSIMKGFALGALGLLTAFYATIATPTNAHAQHYGVINKDNKSTQVTVSGATGSGNGVTYTISGSTATDNKTGKTYTITIPQEKTHRPTQSESSSQYASEIDRLKAEIKQRPNETRLYMNLMSEQIKNKSPPKEIEATIKKGRRIIEADLKLLLDKDNEILYNAFVVGYERIGKYDEAISMCKNLDKIVPDHNYKVPINYYIKKKMMKN